MAYFKPSSVFHIQMLQSKDSLRLDVERRRRKTLEHEEERRSAAVGGGGANETTPRETF